MDSLRQDIRFAIRSFARRPAFAVSAVLSLALGIAASSAVFSIINAALFKPIPGVTKPERLVEISRDVRGEWTDVTWDVFERLRQERSTVEDLGAFALVSASIAGEGEPVAEPDSPSRGTTSTSSARGRRWDARSRLPPVRPAAAPREPQPQATRTASARDPAPEGTPHAARSRPPGDPRLPGLPRPARRPDGSRQPELICTGTGLRPGLPGPGRHPRPPRRRGPPPRVSPTLRRPGARDPVPTRRSEAPAPCSTSRCSTPRTPSPGPTAAACSAAPPRPEPASVPPPGTPPRPASPS